MTWRSEKTKTGNEYVYDGVEFGIAPSPHKGTANIQNANISTESGEVLASYARTAQQQAAISGGTLTPNGATDFTGPATLKAGTWINVTASSVSSITTATNPSTVTCDYLAVGGGGGGGSANARANDSGGGGGGAGQVATGTNAFSVGTTVITVGTGGAGSSSTSSGTATAGVSTSIGAVVTAVGGGGGGNNSSGGSASNGASGASGGGGASDQANGTGGTGGSATAGFAGGNGATAGEGGGGGGAGAVGAAGSTIAGEGGAGGVGVSSSISGSATFYGGGGGGGSDGTGGGAGGNGGGGAGGGNESGIAGTANTGGGGGAGGANGSDAAQAGASGGSGVVVISYLTGSMVAFGGTVTYTSTNTVHTFRETGAFTVVSIGTGGWYYVSYASGTTFRLSAKYDPTGANALTHGTTGTITFSTVAVPNSMVAKATEKYTTASSTKYRYYLLDTNSRVWVWDSLIYETYGTQWMLPDPNDYSTLKWTGIAALNGWCLTVGMSAIYGKPTVNLGGIAGRLDNSFLNEPFPTHRNQAIASQQGKMYYCDGNYIGELFPTTSLITSIANIQSLCSYTSVTVTGTISAVITGSLPYSPDGTRIPAVFFTDVYGSQPSNLTLGTVYYIQYDPENATFFIYDALTGGSRVTPATGAAGNQYFSTFWPMGTIAGINGTTPTVQFSAQRVNLPANETAQCMVEVGNTVIIGGKSTTLYPWNQIDATPSDFIELPEADVKTMVNVNNMAYVFAGNKGNVYITNNSVASLALKVPDYCAGVPGTPLTYIEPTFTWGDADYVRGRVYFSILDQTSTKAGNCGGVWSFVPTQNIDPSQEIGLALRLENQQSYGDYDGYATIILPNQEQTVTSPQYWAAWQDSYSTATSSFGIDYTATTPVTKYVIETDFLATGTILRKETFSQLEYKLATALTSGDSVQIYWRTNATSAWATAGTVKEETNKISGYFEQLFQKTQWLQFRVEVTTGGTTASSFGRLNRLMLR